MIFLFAKKGRRHVYSIGNYSTSVGDIHYSWYCRIDLGGNQLLEKSGRTQNEGSPVVAVRLFYTFYFCGLIGAFTASAIFHTGCGWDGYWHAYLPNDYEIYSTTDDFDYTAWSSIIQKGDSSIINFVAEIKEEDNMIYGMYYPVSEIPGAGIYFSLDTGNGTFTQYGMLEEARANENVVSGLLDIKSFYRSKWGWVMPLIVLSLLAAIGATWGVWRWITGTKKGGKR